MLVASFVLAATVQGAANPRSPIQEENRVRIIDYPLMPRPQRRDVDGVPVELVDASGIDSLVEVLSTADAVAVDTETFNGPHTQEALDCAMARLEADWEAKAAVARERGAAVPRKPQEPFQLWIDLRVVSAATRHDGPNGPEYRVFVLDARDLSVEDIAAAMAAINTPAHGWNVDFDENVLNLYGAPVKEWRDGKFDEAIMWAGFPGRGWWLSLAEAAKRYLNHEVDGKGSVQTSYDGESDLSTDQVDYAGRDALVTLYLSEVFASMLDDAGLTAAADLEQGQRPFLAQMMENGIPFDKDAWVEHLDTVRDGLDETLVKIAQLVLNDDTVVSAKLDPSDKTIIATFADETTTGLFNPDSDPQLRDAFNRYEPEVVDRKFGRPMERNDSVDAATMKELKIVGSDLAPLVLEYRRANKDLTTYGESFLKFWGDGRIRSRYKQTQTATGRLAGDRPNPQNLPSKSKLFTKPGPGRRLIAADYSQAELRGLAAMADEPAMLDPFHAGKDLHAETIRQVFNVDLDELKETDPDAAKKMRTRAKGVNFGIPYGMQARALARRLIGDGVLDGSTPEAEQAAFKEAKELIDKVMETRPKMAAWLDRRDDFVRGFAKNPGPVDWEASFKLLDLFQTFDGPRRAFKRTHKRYPSPMELVEAAAPAPNLFDPGWDDETMAAKAADVDWAFRYDAPVVLRPGVEHNGVMIHDPVAFESRTISGRRRIFAVVMDSGWQRNEDDNGHGGKKNDMFSGLVTSAMLVAATTDKPKPCALRDAWAAANKIGLPSGVDRCPQHEGENTRAYRTRRNQFALEERTRCVKAFDGDRKPLKAEFVKHICAEMGPDGAEFLLSRALADAIGALGPAFRNHPIQGAVADICGRAFAGLLELNKQYPSLIWIQSVHDSIMAECDEQDAVEIAVKQLVIMENAMLSFFPQVPSVVDAEVCLTLDESGIETAVTREMVDEVMSQSD